MDKTKSFLKAIGIIISYLIIIPLIFGVLFQDFLSVEGSISYQIIYILLYVVIIIFLLFIYRNSIKTEFVDFKSNFKKYSKQIIKYWLKGIALMIFFNLIIALLNTNLATNEEANRAILVDTPVMAIILMVILVPFIEEVAFRKGFKKCFPKRQVFAVVTGLIFGAMHVVSSFDSFTIANIIANWKDLLYILSYGSLGYFLGLLYYDTDNIFCSTMAHMIHNGFAILMILISLALGA